MCGSGPGGYGTGQNVSGKRLHQWRGTAQARKSDWWVFVIQFHVCSALMRRDKVGAISAALSDWFELQLLALFPCFFLGLLRFLYSTDYDHASVLQGLVSWPMRSQHLTIEFVAGKFASSEVEINVYARSILKLRMEEGFLHRGRLWDDVLTFDAPEGTVAQGVGGGFPCQAGQFARFTKTCFELS